MEFTIEELENTINLFYKTLKSVEEKNTSVKLGPDKWSLKEIIGHLLDSASNNQQRFVRLQDEQELEFPFYDQERWIQIQKYNEYDWKKLIELWLGYNDLLVHVIKNADGKCMGNLWKINSEGVTLDWLIHDYYRHLKGHIEHFSERWAEIRKQSGC